MPKNVEKIYVSTSHNIVKSKISDSPKPKQTKIQTFVYFFDVLVCRSKVNPSAYTAKKAKISRLGIVITALHFSIVLEERKTVHF